MKINRAQAWLITLIFSLAIWAIIINCATAMAQDEVYTLQGGLLSQAAPEDSQNICLSEREFYETEWLPVIELDVGKGFPFCNRFDTGGTFKLEALDFANFDNNIAEGCRIVTEYNECGYPDVTMGFDIETISQRAGQGSNPFMQNCPLLVNAQIIFADVLERDWCGELADIEHKSEKFIKVAPAIYDLLFNN